MGVDQRQKEEKWASGTWHRKISRPVTVWMIIFILAGTARAIIPDSQWVLIHIFALGVVTNSILVWSQNLTERFLQARLPDSTRPVQLLRSRLLNAGIVAVVLGQAFQSSWSGYWVATWMGCLAIASVLAWHGLSLKTQIRAVDSSKRLRPAALGYVASAWMLTVGAVLGGALMVGLPGVWQTRMAAAHIYVNVAGFVGCAALASLTVLMPAMWRVRGVRDTTSVSLIALLAGIAVAVCGASAGWPPAEGIGLVIYAAGWVWSLQGWVATLIGSRLRPTYPALSALAAVIWLVVSILIHAVGLLRGAESQPPILMLLLGFVAQLLIGTMSYLLPTTMRGGPGAVRAGVRRLDAGGVFRFALYNLALVTWLLAQNSALRMAMSLLVFGVLLAFLPLLGSGVKSQLAVLKGKAEPPAREYDAHAVVQLGVAVATVAVVTVATGVPTSAF